MTNKLAFVAIIAVQLLLVLVPLTHIPYAVARLMYSATNHITNTTANYKACTKYKQSVENISSPNGNFSGTTYDIAHIKADYNLNCKNITGVLPVKLSDFLGGSP